MVAACEEIFVSYRGQVQQHKDRPRNHKLLPCLSHQHQRPWHQKDHHYTACSAPFPWEQNLRGSGLFVLEALRSSYSPRNRVPTRTEKRHF